MLLKRYFFLSFMLFSFAILANSQVHEEKTTTKIDSLRSSSFLSPQIPLTDSIINYGKLFLNTRYRRGSSSATGFDCSGFTSFVYHNFGYNLSHSSSGQAEQVGWIDRLKLKIGDLVFFSGRRKSKKVGHVGIVVSAEKDGKFNFIHSSSQNGVIISSSEEPYYLARFIKAGRVIADNQFLAVVPPVSISENKTDYRAADATVYPVAKPAKRTTKVIPAEYYRVKNGETLSSIAHKFGLTVAELKRKNNIKGNKIKVKQHLKIKDAETQLLVEAVPPMDNKPVETVSQQKKPEPSPDTNISKTEHIVQKGETLFSISNLYNITVDELKKLNNILTGKIRIGQKLKLNKPEQKPVVEVAQNESTVSKPEILTQEEQLKPTVHEVKSGETLFGIAKLYNISVSNLKKLNKLTSGKIKSGQKLKLSADLAESQAPAIIKSSSESKSEKTSKLIHRVREGETFFSIAKKYGCKVEQLKGWNKKTGSKIKVGEKITVYKKTD